MFSPFISFGLAAGATGAGPVSGKYGNSGVLHLTLFKSSITPPRTFVSFDVRVSILRCVQRPVFPGTVEDGTLFYLATNSIIDSSSVSDSITIEPVRYAGGTYVRSDDSSRVSFIPDSTVIFGDNVIVTADNTFNDIYGNELREAETPSFIINTQQWLGKRRK